MKKLTKEQIEALEYLVLDLDELSNKPRRLFSSLIKMAIAFHNEKGDEEYTKEIISDIEEWGEMYYHNINAMSILEDSARMCKKIRKELGRKIPDDWEEKEANRYEQGVDDATKQMALKFNAHLIEELY